MDNYQFVTQAYPNFDPAAHAMYYQDMATASSPQQHQQQHAVDGCVTAYPQFNFQFSPGHANSQHEHHARRIHHLQQQQQHAAFQQQQAIYHQQMMAYQQHCQQIEQAIPSGKRMQTKAERRAEHNAIERARRETLNHKFQQLAHSLPNLQNDRRPSKGTIIERTLDFVKNTVMKEEKFLSEIRKLREEQEELTRQLSTGYQTNGSASDADESDGSSTISRGVSSAVDRLSLNSGPCPSLELSTATSPPLQPTSGSDASMLMGSSIPYNHPIPKDAVQNDVMFGQQDPEHNRQQMILSTTTTYESDDDNSSDNLEEIDHAVHDFNSIYPSMVTMPPSTDFMDKMTPSPAPISSADYGFKFEPQQQTQH